MIFLAIFSSFLAPLFFSLAISALLGGYLIHRGLNNSGKLPEGFGLLISIWALLAALAVIGPTISSGSAIQNVDSLKFVFAGFAFALGAMIGSDHGGVKAALSVFAAVLTSVYAIQFLIGDFISQDSPIYPPDNNHSAAMMAVALPFIVMRLEGWWRLTVLLIILALSFFVTSRALLGLTLIALAVSPKSVRLQRKLWIPVVPLLAAVLLYKGFSLGNFSDQLRLQILDVSYNFAMTRGFHAFNFGEAAFTDFLNIYPIYRQMQIEHAHNVFLQIWVAYGMVPLAVFVTWLSTITVLAWKNKNVILLIILMIFVSMGMIEALVTDVRAFGFILFLFGFAFARGAIISPASGKLPRPQKLAARA